MCPLRHYDLNFKTSCYYCLNHIKSESFCSTFLISFQSCLWLKCKIWYLVVKILIIHNYWVWKLHFWYIVITQLSRVLNKSSPNRPKGLIKRPGRGQIYISSNHFLNIMLKCNISKQSNWPAVCCYWEPWRPLCNYWNNSICMIVTYQVYTSIKYLI